MKKSSTILVLALPLFISCAHQQKAPQVEPSSSYQGFGAGSVSPEKIQKFAPKLNRPDLLRQVQQNLDVRTPGLGLISPDGKSLNFSWSVTGYSQIWQVSSPLSFPSQLTGGEGQTGLVGQTRDGKWLLVSRDFKGEEFPGLYLLPRKGGALVEIQRTPKVQTYFQFVSSDDQWVYFTANDVDPESYALHRWNLASQKKETVFSEKGNWSVMDYDQKDQILLTKNLSNVAREIYLFNLKSKKLEPLIVGKEAHDVELLFTESANTYLALTNQGRDFKAVFKFSDGKYSLLREEAGSDIDSMSFNRQKNKLSLSVNKQGYTNPLVFSWPQMKAISFPAFDKTADQVYLGSWSEDGDSVTVGVVSYNSPRKNYIYNFKTQKATEWVRGSQPEVDLSQAARAKLIQVPARDGASIPTFAYVPQACEKKLCPVVIHFHGGPEAQSTPGFNRLALLFNDRGFIYLEPNVRGSSGYGKAYLDADNAEKRLNVVSDIADLAVFAKKQYSMNSATPKVGVMGWSYGGYSTLLAMTQFAGSYDAGVSLVGISNLVSFLQNTAPYRRKLRVAEYGDPETQKEILLKLSPATYVDQLQAPLLIIQGVNDPRVPVGEAVQMQEKLAAKNKPVELVLFADEGHGSASRNNQATELALTIDFFIRKLQEPLK